jgi:P-type conjugative transfer protein TrbJ
MIFNTMNLPNQILSTFTNNINRIRAIAEGVEGVAYQVAGLGERFQNQFKGFTPTSDYIGMYRDIAKKTRETSEAAIKLIEAAAKENAQDAGKLEDLARASGNAEGNQQAIQAGNQLLSFLGEQLMKLQELNMSYSTFVIEQVQAKNEKEERVEANVQEMHRGLKEGAAALVD